MKKIDQLIVKYRHRIVGTLSLTPDDKLCAFEYDKGWLVDGFSISPLELPLRQGLFIAKPQPFYQVKRIIICSFYSLIGTV